MVEAAAVLVGLELPGTQSSCLVYALAKSISRLPVTGLRVVFGSKVLMRSLAKFSRLTSKESSSLSSIGLPFFYTVMALSVMLRLTFFS